MARIPPPAILARAGCRWGQQKRGALTAGAAHPPAVSAWWPNSL